MCTVLYENTSSPAWSSEIFLLGLQRLYYMHNFFFVFSTVISRSNTKSVIQVVVGFKIETSVKKRCQKITLVSVFSVLRYCLMKTEVGRKWYQSIHFDELSCQSPKLTFHQRCAATASELRRRKRISLTLLCLLTQQVEMASKSIKVAENVYSPLVMVSLGATKRTLDGKRDGIRTH